MQDNHEHNPEHGPKSGPERAPEPVPTGDVSGGEVPSQDPDQKAGSDGQGESPYIVAAKAEAQEKMMEVKAAMEGRGRGNDEDPEVKFMATALRHHIHPRSRVFLDSVRMHVYDRIKDRLRSEVGDMRDYFDIRPGGPVIGAPPPIKAEKEVDDSMRNSRFGMIPYRMYGDIFVSQPYASAHGKAWDVESIDYSGEIVASIIGVDTEEEKAKEWLSMPAFSVEKDAYEIDDKKRQPLTEEDADRLAELMPTLLLHAEYKMAKGGNWRGLSNTAFLLSLASKWFPKKFEGIDITDTIARVQLLVLAAETGVADTSWNNDTRNAIYRTMQGYKTALNSLFVTRGIQLENQASKKVK